MKRCGVEWRPIFSSATRTLPNFWVSLFHLRNHLPHADPFFRLHPFPLLSSPAPPTTSHVGIPTPNPFDPEISPPAAPEARNGKNKNKGMGGRDAGGLTRKENSWKMKKNILLVGFWKKPLMVSGFCR